MELYKKYRPKSLKRIIGQDSAVSVLKSMIKNDKIPHAILFSGPSGCGKTTLARILKRTLECSDADFSEINCADFRGIEMVRDIRRRMNQSPIGGGSTKVYLIDECHKLSNDAQNAFLKLLEDTPKHVYFILATTLATKMLPTVKTRCTEIKLMELSASHCEELIGYVVKKEKKEISEEVMEAIVEHSYGSPRKCLVLLDQIIDIEDEEEQLNAVVKADEQTLAIELARALINPRVKWSDISPILKNLEDDVESLRWMILGYSKAVLIKGGKLAPRAFLLIDAFRDNFYDSKAAGLTAACYEVVTGQIER